ncbi:uncharacterized protein ATNIH1004_008462 [Aspergillus tanneri]|uniref:Jacalin-type lectin domain-containing protein n=1 Tax=Aspergillus tanneri TaxID=1220188 RepID=A0A5M9MGZ4_9EURO|nr:uncharacterized protein ATNIH1004_008462 [Aspergillus tanneri]KAA8644263.1 hypothetical protein ATNIH1004_008462 [Aspergillus tanneri]
MDSSKKQDAGQPRGVIETGPFGDGGGDGVYNLYPGSSTYVTKIEAWVGRADNADVITGLKLYWADGTPSSIGGHPGDNIHSYEFKDDEVIDKMTVYTGWNLDRISFQTNRGGKFDHGGSHGYDHEISLGNGKMVGLKGKFDKCITQITTAFQMRLETKMED